MFNLQVTTIKCIYFYYNYLMLFFALVVHPVALARSARGGAHNLVTGIAIPS